MGKKHRKKNNNKYLRVLKKFYQTRIKQEKETYNLALEVIPKLYSLYSISDITTSLFVSSLWLPNIASPVKHLFFVTILASMDPCAFSSDDHINGFAEFKDFLERLYKLAPNFSHLEDYLPECDWGEMKFLHEDNIYDIFYGCEFENIYDYLILYQILYLPFQAQYFHTSKRSPTRELRYCLQLQNDIISAISTQPLPEVFLDNLSPGHLDIPSESFWANACQFYKEYKVEQIVDQRFLESFGLKVGEFPKESLQWDNFVTLFQKNLMPNYFLTCQGKNFLILPRRYSCILFDSWSPVFRKYSKTVAPKTDEYRLIIQAQVYRFMKDRIRSSFMYPLVSAAIKGGHSHTLVFSAAFTSKDRLVLIYITNPLADVRDMEEELQVLSIKAKEALDIMNSPPLTLALHTERMSMVLQEGFKLKLDFLIVVPQISSQSVSFRVPPLPGRVVFVDEFIGLIDEMESINEIADFIKYVEEYESKISNPSIRMLDVYGSFKASYGVLIEGAEEVDFISLDPHWGSGRRYKTLSAFWKAYPKHHFFGDPRSWEVKPEGQGKTRLIARGYFGSAIYCNVGNSHIFVNSPFDLMSYEIAQIADLIIHSLADVLVTCAEIIEGHAFFGHVSNCQFLFFPSSLVKESSNLNHLQQLLPENTPWNMDWGKPKKDLIAIRIVYDDKMVSKRFMEATDRSFEIELMTAVLKELNKIKPDEGIDTILTNLEKKKEEKPRFKAALIEREVSFPEFTNPHKPSATHFKTARKRIAEMASEAGLEEGEYELEKAKSKVDTLRKALVGHINDEVARFNFFKAIPFLLERTDALIDSHERVLIGLEQSIDRQVEYRREEHYATAEKAFISMHRSYRYLIEKFVQLQPSGSEQLDPDQFGYLIALVDWLLTFYGVSDVLHYGIEPVRMKVNRDLVCDVIDKKDRGKNEKAFAEEEAGLRLGVIGNQKDRLKPPDVDKFLERLDNAFTEQFGFSFQEMTDTLRILAQWASIVPNTPVNAFYHSNESEIEETVLKVSQRDNRGDTKKILDFLTLQSSDVLKVLGQTTLCNDLPVWEYRKRSARYTIRPIIKIEDEYYWGPHSVLKSAKIWSGALGEGTLPLDVESPIISAVLKEEKRLIERALEKKAFEIVSRYTNHVVLNCRLHNIDREGNHPEYLGDYDVLGYFKDKNIVINVECKDLLPAHCAKDARRLRENIFGEQVEEDGGHFLKISRRSEYLMKQWQRIGATLKWPHTSLTAPIIITLYVTRINYWWTMFPPKNVDAFFLRIDMLSSFLEDLLST